MSLPGKMNSLILCMSPLFLLVLLSGSSAARISRLSESLDSVQDDGGDVWAVLVAGSNGYFNYRHQADVCHAYQVLKSHGIPDKRIIVMMYDDIASNDKNPTPGIIVNHPNGPDVYKGVPKDYVGDDVTPENFLKVLAGDVGLKESGKKVLGSSSSDHVFVFFSDHGAPGLVAFPNSELSAKKLNKALLDMHVANRFKRLVIYVEACEAGSMFKHLLPNGIDVYAVTAANEKESSYATYWDKERYAFLGDEFSVNWMEDSDAHPDLSKESLQQQFLTVREKTEQSHVMMYGNVSIASLPVSQFQGNKVAKSGNRRLSNEEHECIPSPDVPVMVAYRRWLDHPENSTLKAEYESLAAARKYMDSSRRHLASKLVQVFGFPEEIGWEKQTLTQHDCYETLFQTFDQNCFDVSSHPHALTSLYLLVNVCETLESTSQGVFGVESVADFLAKECARSVQNHPFKSIE